MVKEWENVTLGKIGSFEKGAGISRAESNSGKINAVRYGELYTSHNNYIRSYYSHISKEVSEHSHRVQYGDILFACSGETKKDIAKCATIIDKTEVYAGGDIIVLSPYVKTDPIFMGYLLNTPFVISQRAQKAQGDAVVHISIDSIKSIEIKIPEYEEQCKIAETLYDIDELIINLEKLIAKKEAIKQGTMQELLTGKRRLPEFDGEWKPVYLGEYCKMFAGGTPNSKVNLYYGGDIPWVSISDISVSGKYIDDTEKHLTDEGLNNSSARIYPPNSLLFAMYASIGKCCIAKSEVASSQAILGIFDFENIELEFLYYYLCFNQKKYIEMGQTGTQSNLSKKIVEKIEINKPSVKEQAAIASVLSDMDCEIDALKSKLTKAKNIKQGMMNELLTGKIRLV